LLADQKKLKGMRKGNLKRIVLSPRPALEQKFPLLAYDQKFGSLPRSAGELNDRIDYPNVKMRHDNGQFLSRELLSLAGGSAGAGAGNGALG
jgi:hypothetical protein